MSMLPLSPTLLLNLAQLERGFRRILGHIHALFNLAIRALKSGNPERYRAALVALREMNFYIKLAISTITSHIPRMYVPFAPDCISSENQV